MHWGDQPYGHDVYYAAGACKCWRDRKREGPGAGGSSGHMSSSGAIFQHHSRIDMEPLTDEVRKWAKWASEGRCYLQQQRISMLCNYSKLQTKRRNPFNSSYEPDLAPTPDKDDSKRKDQTQHWESSLWVCLFRELQNPAPCRPAGRPGADPCSMNTEGVPRKTLWTWKPPPGSAQPTCGLQCKWNGSITDYGILPKGC